MSEYLVRIGTLEEESEKSISDQRKMLEEKEGLMVQVKDLEREVESLWNQNSDLEEQLRRVQEKEETKSYEDDDDDFEFPCVCENPSCADDIFYNGHIRPVFPIFGRDLLFSDVENCKGEVNSSKPPTPSPIRIPLAKLMSEDCDPPLCSFSKADELDGVPVGTYCV
ncbi:hypothetical protein LOK49_LG01G04039 [Camellia lanceoleosa]|uniref:Uncharacterized protein n=1 Tax=Camellia lanceoleosa TaxID=1840588 RepID=A0ACC0J531_9ERIC|nr:hypothetical protein LOK49_LG01G04039 [Camellia lanceoleosa]